MVEKFWETTQLQDLTQQEWESLCDGCGKCCLHKLEDDETGKVHYTRVACKLLDVTTCRCTQYKERLKHVPDCIQLKPSDLNEFNWLPKTCAYRLVSEGKSLFKWHPLLAKKTSSARSSTVKKGKSVADFALNEQDVDDLQDHIIQWVEI